MSLSNKATLKREKWCVHVQASLAKQFDEVQLRNTEVNVFTSTFVVNSGIFRDSKVSYMTYKQIVQK